MQRTSDLLIEALQEAGISCIFANFGSDHSGLLESIAERRTSGRPVPQILTAPHEMVALSAAHGYAMVSGVPQAVLVHVECGTQSLAGAVHNIDKGRVPALIIAGLSPYTQEGELPGGRNEFIQWIQDVHDQTGIVRGYMRYTGEIRTGRNLRQLVARALNFACSDPPGPAYLTIAREVLEESIPAEPQLRARPRGLASAALSSNAAEEIAAMLSTAERPLVVTSYLGRNATAVGLLVELSQRFALGVLESVPTRMNFPHDNALYLGSQWNEPLQNAVLEEADFILVIDSDVPWIPAVSRPGGDARICHIDVDPLKRQMPLWDIGAHSSHAADAAVAMEQILKAAPTSALDKELVASRRAYFARHRARLIERLASAEAKPRAGLTLEFLLSRLRNRLGAGAIVLNEGITNYPVVHHHLMPTRAGTLFASGGGSLGWNGGAAIGAKLAAPESDVVTITGDGSYMFSIPSAVHWMARRYGTPFLQIILNNGGWNAPRHSMLAVHPAGHGSRAADLDIGFDPAPDYGQIAVAAGGALARPLVNCDDVDAALDEAFHAIRTQQRCCVLDVQLKS